MEGVDQERPLLDDLVEHRDRSSTGVLDVVALEGRLRVALRDGEPVWAERPDKKAAIGKLLVERNVIAQEEHDAIVDDMTVKILFGGKTDFASAAIDRGAAATEVRGALEAYVTDLLVDAIGWFEPEASFEADASLGRYEQPVALERVALQALRIHFDPPRLRRILAPALHRHARLADSDDLIVEAFGLDDGQRDRLEAFRSWAPLHRHLDDACRSGDPCLFAALVALGCFSTQTAPPPASTPAPKLASEPPPASTSSRPATSEPASPPRRSSIPPPLKPQVRRVDPRVDHLPVRNRVRPNVRRRDRVSLHRLRQATFHAEGKPSAASITGIDDPAAQRREAERLFSDGWRRLRLEHYDVAARNLSRAHELVPTVEREVYAGFAAWLAHRKRPEGADREHDLRRLVQRLLEADERCAAVHYVYGHLQLHRGDDRAAEASFRRACDLDTNHLEARRWLLQVQVGLRPSS